LGGAAFSLVLQPLGLLDSAISLGADSLLLALDLGNLVLHPLFGYGGILVANRWR
jgi:hypothetical protein